MLSEFKIITPFTGLLLRGSGSFFLPVLFQYLLAEHSDKAIQHRRMALYYKLIIGPVHVSAINSVCSLSIIPRETPINLLVLIIVYASVPLSQA